MVQKTPLLQQSKQTNSWSKGLEQDHLIQNGERRWPETMFLKRIGKGNFTHEMKSLGR